MDRPFVQSSRRKRQVLRAIQATGSEMRNAIVAAAIIIASCGLSHAADFEWPRDGIGTMPRSYVLSDTAPGTRLDNLLHCILFRVELVDLPTAWREVCTTLMEEATKTGDRK